MRTPFVIAVLLAAGVADAGAAAPMPPHSWGKVGISYLQYRTDAAECAYAGLAGAGAGPGSVVINTAVQGTPPSPGPAGALAASNAAVSNLYAALDSYRADLMMAEHKIYKAMQSADEQCLTARGYARFRLTEEQVARLSRLKPGTHERYSYLYSLAVDPRVLQSQALVEKRRGR